MSDKIWKIEDVFHLPESDLRFYGTMGIEDITERDDGSVTVWMPVTHAMLNGHGTVQGGAVCALCDMAAAAYMRIRVGNEVTVDSTIQFYRPAAEGAILTATVAPRKIGKTLCTVFCEITDEEGTRIADSTQTFYRLYE
ncbi:MAG: PaaI family thioesterase [Firmicutes bacterium]|nr:PaaI family thioesterase [Bacillota bacterium]